MCEWEDGKAEPWKAHHKSRVSEQKPELSPWHTVPILNKLWNIEQKKRFVQKIPGKIRRSVCYLWGRYAAWDRVFCSGKIMCLQKQSFLNFFVRRLWVSLICLAAHYVTIWGWWAVFLGFCKEQEMKCLKKFREESKTNECAGNNSNKRLGLWCWDPEWE